MLISRIINITDELSPWKVAYVVWGCEVHSGKHASNDREAAALLLNVRRKELVANLKLLTRMNKQVCMVTFTMLKQDPPFSAYPQDKASQDCLKGVTYRLKEVENCLLQIAPGLMRKEPPKAPKNNPGEEEDEEEEEEDTEEDHPPQKVSLYYP